MITTETFALSISPLLFSLAPASRASLVPAESDAFNEETARRSFRTASGTVDWSAILLCAVAFVAMLRYKIDIIPVIIGAGILGLLYNFLRGFS
jgi:hypothetical protein